MTEKRSRPAGGITKRGAGSWRVKIALPKGADGKRRTRYITIRGSKQDARRPLATALLDTNPIAGSRQTVEHYLTGWLRRLGVRVSAKTLERHTELVRLQILPFLGHVPLQGLRNADVAEWHTTLLLCGNHKGGPLSRQTVAKAHIILGRALADAVQLEIIGRNPCATIKPPRAAPREARSLQAEQVEALLKALQTPGRRGSVLRPIATLALGTGMRRGEILGLRWSDLDLKSGSLTIAQSVEQTKAGGVVIKQPKTKAGRRTIALAPATIEMLRAWRTLQAEARLAYGQGRPEPHALLFPTIDGGPRNPDTISNLFAQFVRTRGLPAISLHGLRHTHASALIRGAIDIASVAGRLGHANPSTTLRTYTHLFERTDHAVSAVVEGLLKPGR